jgi:RNA polymerase sigma-70 factor (ECF subfamily)
MGRAGPDAVVSAARSGDPDSWRLLYERHARRLVVWLRSLPLLDTAASADDLAAEAWLTAAERIDDFRGGDDDFAPWLFTIARNHAANSGRKAARRRTEPVDVGEAGDAVFGSVADESGRVAADDRTRALLSHLSPREAEVVACIDVVGLDVAATAAALGMRPTAVRVARHRALGRLRRVLEQEDERAGRPDAHGQTSDAGSAQP